MADRRPLEETWRQILDANLTYYRGLSELSIRHLNAVVSTLSGVRLPMSLGQVKPGRPPASATHDAAGHARAPAAAAAPPTALVLEAEAGGCASGLFMVDNRLHHPVTAPIVASAFRDSAGREGPAPEFEPATVTMAPGEQTLVRVSVVVPVELDAGTTHRAEVTVPGLGAETIHLLMRRRVVPGARDAEPSRPSRARAGRRHSKPAS